MNNLYYRPARLQPTKKRRLKPITLVTISLLISAILLLILNLISVILVVLLTKKSSLIIVK